MSSAENPPPLALSDIMHPMSPSPAPLDERYSFSGANLHGRTSRDDHEPSPEPPTNVEILQFRQKVVEMGLTAFENVGGQKNSARFSSMANNLSEREKELVDMILRLTSGPRVEATQLEEQARAISRLTVQREYLIAQADEERGKWQSERESWDRTAEALLTQKTRPRRSEDFERQRAGYEAEIKDLSDKLHDRQRRLESLEQEVVKLKPLLLMHSYPSSHVTQTLSTHVLTSKATDQGKRRSSGLASGRDHLRRDNPDSSYRASSSKLNPLSHSSINVLSSSSSGSHPVSFEGAPKASAVTQRRKGKETGKTRKSKHLRTTPIFSDAYSEHILLASQKIGRKRSTLVTSLHRIEERERELLAQEQALTESKLEQDRLQKEYRSRATTGATNAVYYRPVGDTVSPQRTSISRTGSNISAPPPQTPHRNDYPLYGSGPTNNPNPGGINTPSPSAHVFANIPATPPSNTSSAYNQGATLNTPSPLGTALNTAPGIRSSAPNNPPTPLDSLVDAARMMGENNDRIPVNGRQRPLDEPDSPTSKRRKVSADKARLPNRQGPKIDRVKSALDVLADQAAAAVNEPGQSSQTSSSLGISAYADAPSETKGKGRVNSKDQIILGDQPMKSSKSRTSSRTVKPSAKKRGISAETASASTSTSSRTTTRSRGPKHPVVTSSGSRVIAHPSRPSLFFEASGTTSVGSRAAVGWGDRDAPSRDNEGDDDCQSDSPRRPHAIPQNPPRDISSQSYGSLIKSFAPANGYRAYSHEFDQAARRPITPLRTPEPPNQLYSPELSTPNPEPSTMLVLSPPPSLSFTAMENSMPKSQIPSSTSRSKQSNSKPSTEAEQDEDAEGEEEDDAGDADADHGRDHPRTRSPPPPDPPPPGFDNGASPGDEHDADPDADAEGDMDTDQTEEPSSRMTDSANEQSRVLRLIERNLDDALTRARRHTVLSSFHTDLACRPPHDVDFATKSTHIGYRSIRSNGPFLVRRLSESRSTAPSHCGVIAEFGRRSGLDSVVASRSSGEYFIHDVCLTELFTSNE